MATRIGKSGNSERFYFLGRQTHCGQRLLPRSEKTLAPWKESYDKLRHHFKKQRHHFAKKKLALSNYGFSSRHVWMWNLDHKEGWVPKNWFFLIIVLEKTLESPLDYKDIKSVNPKENQPWIFIGRSAAEAPMFGHLMWRGNSWQSPWCWERFKAKEEGGSRGGDVG